MQPCENKKSARIVDALSSLIELTKAANLGFTTQLLQIAHLDVLMSLHGISPEELDALAAAFERQSQLAPVLDLEQLRRSRRRQRTSREG